MKNVSDFIIIENCRLNTEYFILKLQKEGELHPQNDAIFAGQFVQILIPNNKTFLRRPISIFDVNYDVENKILTIFLLIKIAGKGTEELSKLQENQKINLIYPLGNHFSTFGTNEIEKTTLLIGGGVGIAPLFYLGKFLPQKNLNFLLGYRNKESVILKEKFEEIGKIFITTDDGSFGEKGTVLQHYILKNQKFDKIYACGPTAMLKSVAKYAEEKNIDCELSLENLMACGIGACLCCVNKKITGTKSVCVDGPVFNIKELNFN